MLYNNNNQISESICHWITSGIPLVFRGKLTGSINVNVTRALEMPVWYFKQRTDSYGGISYQNED